MPIIKVETNVNLPEASQKELLQALSQLVAQGIGKPERYVMATLGLVSAVMSAKAGPAAFAEVRSIGGLSPEVNRRLAESLCRLVEKWLRVPPDRVYLNFIDVPASDWGWNGETFG